MKVFLLAVFSAILALCKCQADDGKNGFDTLCSVLSIQNADIVEKMLGCMDGELKSNLLQDLEKCLDNKSNLKDSLTATCQNGKMPEDKVKCVVDNVTGLQNVQESQINDAANKCKSKL